MLDQVVGEVFGVRGRGAMWVLCVVLVYSSLQVSIYLFQGDSYKVYFQNFFKCLS